MMPIYPLTFDWNKTTANGITEVMSLYKSSLNSILFSGPTLFAPIINNIASIIRNFNNPNEYFVLILLTDGINHDMQDTIDAIVEASELPLSIIIIGIGNEDFTNMEILDGDDTPLISSKGVRTKRDIVQFVPFNKFYNNPTTLAKEVLYEIPTQISQYSKLKNIVPKHNLYVSKASLTF